MTFMLTRLDVIDSREFRYVLRTRLANYDTRGGVYRLYEVDERYHPVALSRLLGTDPNGTLYLGACADYEERACGLFGSLKGGSRSHVAGVILAQHPRLRERFPLERLAVEFKPGASEAEALDAYWCEFGESPPFNTRTRGRP